MACVELGVDPQRVGIGRDSAAQQASLDYPG